MGGKVIKINLVGAIFTIILIIAAIVGLITIINKPKDKKEETNNQKEEVVNQDKENYTELDTIDTIKIDGEKKEILMRKYESKHGYSINYDVNSFYIDDRYEQYDYFKSLVSDTVEMKIIRVDNSFNELKTSLNANIEQMKQVNKTYELKETKIGENQVIEEQMLKDEIVSKTYFVQTKKGYFEIKTTCGEKFEKETYLIIEKMIESLEVM